MDSFTSEHSWIARSAFCSVVQIDRQFNIRYIMSKNSGNQVPMSRSTAPTQTWVEMHHLLTERHVVMADSGVSAIWYRLCIDEFA